MLIEYGRTRIDESDRLAAAILGRAYGPEPFGELDIALGQRTLIVGAPGSGKSELLREAGRLVPDDESPLLIRCADLEAEAGAPLELLAGLAERGIGLRDGVGVSVEALIHAIELKPGKGAQLCRSAGAQAQLLAKEGARATLKMPSGEVRLIALDCMATVGQVGNLDHENVSVGKAGRVRWLGFRPTVRGTVMNPVDHPMGGGEGKGKGNHPMTPWGKPTKGYKTRRGARPSDRDIVTRRGR